MTNGEAAKMLQYNLNVIHQTKNGETDPREVLALEMGVKALLRCDTETTEMLTEIGRLAIKNEKLLAERDKANKDYRKLYNDGYLKTLEQNSKLNKKLINLEIAIEEIIKKVEDMQTYDGVYIDRSDILQMLVELLGRAKTVY